MKYSNTIPIRAFSKTPYAYFNVGVRKTTEAELRELLSPEEELSEEFIVEHKYCYSQVKLQLGKLNYSSIVDAIISDKYPNDKMQAIINNYLLDPTDAESLAEFNEMQKYRQYAKQFARDITNQTPTE